jgi:hypothetical protein
MLHDTPGGWLVHKALLMLRRSAQCGIRLNNLHEPGPMKEPERVGLVLYNVDMQLLQGLWRAECLADTAGFKVCSLHPPQHSQPLH